MSQKIFFFFALIFAGILPAQQNAEFRQVKQYFDNQRNMLVESFRRELNSGRSESEKAFIRQHYTEFMTKLDSVQNYAFIGTLIKVKNLEDLGRLSNSGNYTKDEGSSAPDANAEYPGGFDAFRQQLADLFYSGEILPNAAVYRATVRFVVERDGSISTVEAFGDNYAFNRQAVLAVYLLPDSFQPARYKGSTVRSRFSVPLVLKFD